jgi:hypothetical protein
MPTIRSFVRPKQYTKSIQSDNNNNELSRSLPINQELPSDTKLPISSTTNRQLAAVDEKSDMPVEKAQNQLKEPSIEQFDSMHTTSTPHLNHKVNADFANLDVAAFNVNELKKVNLNRTSTSIHKKLVDSDNEKVCCKFVLLCLKRQEIMNTPHFLNFNHFTKFCPLLY